MKRLTMQPLDQCAGPFRQKRRLGLEAGGVERITHHGMTDMGHMHADLVGASRLQRTAHQAYQRLALLVSAEASLDLKMGDGLPATLLRHDSLFLAMPWVAAQWGLNRAGAALHGAPDKSEIVAGEREGPPVIGKQVAQRLMRFVILGDHQKAGCVLIEPMDDTGALDAPNARQGVAAMGNERIDECAAFMAGSGMHDEPGRLVDDDEIVVFKSDIKRNGFALRFGRGRFRHLDLDPLAGLHLQARILGRFAINAHMARFNEGLDARA